MAGAPLHRPIGPCAGDRQRGLTDGDQPPEVIDVEKPSGKRLHSELENSHRNSGSSHRTW